MNKLLITTFITLCIVISNYTYAEGCGEELSPSQNYLLLDEYHIVHGDLYLCTQWDSGECISSTYQGFGFFDLFENYLGYVPNDASEDVIWDCFGNGYYQYQMTFVPTEDTLVDGNYILQPYNYTRTQKGLSVKIQSHVTGNLLIGLTPWNDVWHEYNSSTCPSGWSCGDQMIRYLESFGGNDYIMYPVCDEWDPCENFERNTETYTGEGDDYVLGSQCSDIVIMGDGNDYVYDKHGWNSLSTAESDSPVSDVDYIFGCGQLFRPKFLEAQCLSSTGTYDTMSILLKTLPSGQHYDENNITSLSSSYDYEIIGTGGDDYLDLHTYSVNFIIHGGSGDDILISGSGDDIVEGNGGDDTIRLSNGEDTAYGDNYLSTYGTPGDDKIYAYGYYGNCVVGTGCTNGICKRLYGQYGEDEIYFSCNKAYIEPGRCQIPYLISGGDQLISYNGYSSDPKASEIYVSGYMNLGYNGHCNIYIYGTTNFNDIDISGYNEVWIQGGNYGDYINVEETYNDLTITGGKGNDNITVDDFGYTYGTIKMRIDVAGEEGEDTITISNVIEYEYTSIINGGMANGSHTVDPDTQTVEQDDVDCGCVYSWCGSQNDEYPPDYNYGEYTNCLPKLLDGICPAAPQCSM